MKQKIRKIFQKQKKKKMMNILRNQLKFLIMKKNIIYPYHRDDLDYYGIKNIENLFDKVNEEDY